MSKNRQNLARGWSSMIGKYFWNAFHFNFHNNQGIFKSLKISVNVYEKCIIQLKRTLNKFFYFILFYYNIFMS